MKKILIAISPVTHTYGPSLAPALLKACIPSDKYNSVAWDLSAEFNCIQGKHVYFDKITHWLKYPEVGLTSAEYEWYKSIIKLYADKVLTEYKPDILCLSLMTINSLRFTEDLTYAIKVVNPDIKIIVGGKGITCNIGQFGKTWYQLMLDGGLIDTAIMGEGELSLPYAIEHDQCGVINVPQLTNEEFEEVPFPDYSDYDFSWYPKQYRSYWRQSGLIEESSELVFLLTASKGCIKHCTFCDTDKWWPKYRVRSGSKVAEEMIYLHKEFGATFFNFTDSLMNGGLKPFNDMNIILSEKLPSTIKYEGQFIFRSEKAMPERYFEAMAIAGCRMVSIGLESGDEKVREHMKKGSTDEDLVYSSEMFLKYNILQDWNIIVGYPTETDESWRITMDTIKYWVERGQGKITINPSNVFLLIDGTPIMEPEYMRELQISQLTMSGYSSFNWTSGINKGNTFEVRVERFLELCNYLLEYDNARYAKTLVTKMTDVRFHLDVYNNKFA
jgi:Radical SAM superfamily